MKLSKATFVAAVAVLITNFCATNASANEWKMGPLSDQVSVIQEAQDFQETDRREFLCAALAIYHESKGETKLGMDAVGSVVKNRVHDPRFPKTVCGVVWQKSQFSWTIRPVGAIVPREKNEWIKAQKIALEQRSSDADPTNGANYFYNVVTDRPAWRTRGKRTLTVGVHAFIRIR